MIVGRESISRLDPNRPSVSYSGPSTVTPLYLPSAASVIRLQWMKQERQDTCFLTLRYTPTESIFSSAFSQVLNWKFFVGRIPPVWVIFSVSGVPYFILACATALTDARRWASF